ncbi:LuxR C-terminal-related transcriptional regulator [Actinomadura scrupuli]|uniref:helix-turn-helix transcriptional regulator n=1 Tax=Actinomadura scrupuli TaxID=559629 RepID=UPI003D990D31
MGEQDTGLAVKLLDGVVEGEVLAAYLKLVEAGGCPGEEAEDFLGGTALVRTLIGWGMAHLNPADTTNPPRLMPAPPHLALQAAMGELYGGWRDHHQRMMNGHQRLRDLHHDLPRPGGGEHPAVRVITDRGEISQLSASLIGSVRRDMMTLDNCLQETPIQDTSVIPPLPRFKGTVRYRSIYQANCLDNPVVARAVERSVQAGEEARVLPEVGMKMKLVDDTTVMLPLTPTGMGGALILHAPPIVGELRKHFEMLWKDAIPLGSDQAPNRSPLTDIQHQVLRLLCQGLDDEAVAGRTRISATTVRRHYTAIKDLLGTESRMATGAAAVRRGWVQ